jgi:hypothetical protein
MLILTFKIRWPLRHHQQDSKALPSTALLVGVRQDFSDYTKLFSAFWNYRTPVSQFNRCSPWDLARDSRSGDFRSHCSSHFSLQLVYSVLVNENASAPKKCTSRVHSVFFVDLICLFISWWNYCSSLLFVSDFPRLSMAEGSVDMGASCCGRRCCCPDGLLSYVLRSSSSASLSRLNGWDLEVGR